MPDQLNIFFNPRKAPEKNADNNTPPPIGQVEKRTTPRATDIVWHWTLATMATAYIPTDSSF